MNRMQRLDRFLSVYWSYLDANNSYSLASYVASFDKALYSLHWNEEGLLSEIDKGWGVEES